MALATRELWPLRSRCFFGCFGLAFRSRIFDGFLLSNGLFGFLFSVLSRFLGIMSFSLGLVSDLNIGFRFFGQLLVGRVGFSFFDGLFSLRFKVRGFLACGLGKLLGNFLCLVGLLNLSISFFEIFNRTGVF